MRDHLGDDVHPVAFTDGHIEPITQFRYQDLDPDPPEDMVSFSDMSAVFSLILQWACHTDNLTQAGARIAALLTYLDPVNAPHGRNNLSEIARQAGCTRSALSKALVQLRDQCGIHLTIGRLGSARETYARAQRASIAAGTHSSTHRKDAKPSTPSKPVDPALSARMRATVMARYNKPAQALSEAVRS